MPIFDVLGPKENQFFSELFQKAQGSISQDLNILLSQPVILSRFSLDYNPTDVIKTSFKNTFLAVNSNWDGDVSGLSSILVRVQDAKAMCGFLMMEPITKIKADSMQPLTDEDMETFQEIANQINGSFDNGLRQKLKFDFHVKFKEVTPVDFTDEKLDISQAFPEKGYVYVRSSFKIGELSDSFLLQLFPLELIKSVSSLQVKELAEEEELREKGDLRTIMLIDYDEVQRKIAKNYLKDSEYITVDAKDGMEALGFLRKKKVDLVMIEVDLPGINGFQVCQRIKTNPNTRNIPVVFFSNKSTKENVIKAINGGGQDFLVKPIQKDFLLDRIKNILG